MEEDDVPWSERSSPSAARFVTIFVLLPIGTLLCLMSLLISPYTSWGGEREFLRPDMAAFSRDFSYAALVAFGAVSVAAWAGRPRWRWWDYPLIIFVAFLIGVTLLRIAYLIFKVGLPMFAILDWVDLTRD